jgi:predicted PurR-regulated permease PerM
MIPRREFTRRMLETVLTVAAVTVLCVALWVARSALMLIYVSAIIAMGFSPLVRVIELPRKGSGTHRVPRTLAILAIYLVIVGAIVVVGLMIVPPLVEQAGELWTRAPRLFRDFQRFLMRYRLLSRPVTLEEAVQNAPAAGGSAINTVLAAISSVVGGAFGIVTILILSFYLLVEGQALFEHWMRFVPAQSRGRFFDAARQSVQKVSAWLSAQLILAGVMGIFAALGLGLMGVPYFYVVALIAAVGETIPIVGPIVAGVSAVAIALSVSAKLALFVGGYFVVLHQFEANILVPKIMERRVGVSPVTVIVALLIGGELWGLVGAILAIPTVAILTVVLDEMAANVPEAGTGT